VKLAAAALSGWMAACLLVLFLARENDDALEVL
jgi:hypothetical protein